MTAKNSIGPLLVSVVCSLILFGCTREEPTAPQPPQRAETNAAPAVAQFQGSLEDIPTGERFRVSVRVVGSVRVGSPVSVTLDVEALHATTLAEIALRVPELEQLVATGDFRSMEVGRRNSASFVWRGRLAEGQRISRTVQLRFPRAGYYTVLGTATKVSSERDTAWVSDNSADLWYAHVEPASGTMTRGIDKAVFRPGMLPGPGPFRIRGAGGAVTMSDCTEITDPNCFPPPQDPPPGPRDCCMTVEYLYASTYQPYTIAPAPRLRLSLFYQTEVYTGITDANGRVTGLPCPRSGEQNVVLKSVMLEPGQVNIEDDWDAERISGWPVSTSWCHQTTQLVSQQYSMIVYQRLLKVIASAQAVFGRHRGQLPVRIVYSGETNSFYRQSEDRVYILQSHIDGEFGKFVVSHEYGHAFHNGAIASGLQGGGCPSPHYLYRSSGQGCAYSEGFADFFSAATLVSTIGADIERNDWRPYPGGVFGPDVEGAVAGYLLDLVDPTWVSQPIENDPVAVPGSGVVLSMDFCRDGSYYWTSAYNFTHSIGNFARTMPSLQNCLNYYTPNSPTVQAVYGAPFPQLILRGELSQGITLPSGWTTTGFAGLYAWNILYTGR